MTLNILLVTPWGIHLSADFRLSQLERNYTQGWVPISNSSSKIVTVVYEDWVGFISYCGLGMSNGVHTYEYVAEWLSHDDGQDRTFEDIVRILQLKGSTWLAEIARRTGKLQPHTFIVAGFIDTLMKVALISNYETFGIPLSSIPHPVLVESSIATRHTKLIITGISQAVSKEDRTFLRYLGKRYIDADVIRYRVAEINARAAASEKSYNGISQSCLAYSLLSDGSGMGECYGDVDGEMTPIMLMYGMNSLGSLKINPSPGRKIRMEGFTIANTRSHQKIINEYIKCDPVIEVPKLTHPRIDHLVLSELALVNEYYCSPRKINDQGEIVGESRIPISEPPHAFRWTKEIGIQDLGTLGGPQSMAHDVNNHGAIVGGAQTHPYANHAFLWTPEQGMVSLGTLGGRDSIAYGINNIGHIVGYSGVLPGEPTQNDQWAFLWTPEGGMVNIGTLAKTWSRAYDINDNGQVIGVSPVDGFIHAFLWTEQGGMQDLGTLGGNFTSVVAINNQGVILGESEVAPNQRHIFIWTENRGMIDLGFGIGYQPLGINDLGEVIGTYKTGIRTHAFLWSETNGLLTLPQFRDHHTAVSAINNNGDMVGRSTRNTWKHLHAILWSVLPRGAENVHS